jgi:Ca2+-binding RTX toxin-like protein
MSATGGTYTLSLLLPNTLVPVTTAAIPFDAPADAVDDPAHPVSVRQFLQNAIVANDPRGVFRFDVMVDRYRDGLNRLVYVIGFQGNLRQVDNGPGANFLILDGSGLSGGGATLQTRMDGFEYFGVESLGIDTGSGLDVLNVQGVTRGSNGFTGTAVTNVRLHNGDDKVFISSNADQDLSSWQNVDFLTGNLDDVRGALNIDLGAGRHELFMSDEGTTHADTWTIGGTDNAIAIARGAQTPITYTFDASLGNLYDGVAYWTSSLDDTVTISQIARHAGQRTTTSLNTGLGDDTVTATLDDGGDAFFVANLSGGAATGDPHQHTAGAASDNDSFDGSGSALPLVVFGGFGNDTIRGGSNRDILVGDFAHVQYTAAADPTQLLAQFGYGGRRDLISSTIVDPRWIYSFVPDLTVGSNDTIYGNGGEDVIVGGALNDALDGGAADDLLFGDAVQLYRRDVTLGSTGDITSPRYQSLSGTQIYSTADATLGQVLYNNVPLNARDGNGAYAPDWAEYQIRALYQTYAVQAANDHSFGSDYIAGGAADDMIFGQLGNDVIQGDGSIDIAPVTTLTCTSGTVGAANWSFSQLVGACRADADSVLQINPSADSLAADGSDYIEGNGGSDTIFGNQGQDDIVGGNSDLFTLAGACSAANETSGAAGTCRRPDAPNTIFGGSGGSDIARNDMGATGANSEAHDADVVVANNGDIVRLVATGNGTAATGFLTFGYDTAAFEGGGSERIVPRAVKLLDYTPGGTDLQGTTGPIVSGDIGAGAIDANLQARGTEVHGGQGDDVVYGGPANDVLFGDGQNDVLIGGYGNDWISGGTGDDGVLGDDGRIFVSRVGIAEPLYGIGVDASQNELISTPGTMQEAVINTTGAVRYTAVLTPDNLDPSHAVPGTTTPRPTYANDIIYGGLQNDALHGGAGDDAMTGAEAPAVAFTDNYSFAGAQLNAAPIPSDFAHPYNPGNVLGYSDTTTYQAQYDPNDVFRLITLTSTGALDKSAAGGMNWLLSFAASEGPLDTIWATGTSYPAVATDGNDALFGDLGNDWMVGGSGRDTMYGGWGNDYLNADDVLNTGNAVTNTGTDTNPSYEDLAFGGAGRDVLVANTGGDRLIDWIGEFNSYLVPFAPYGMATVSRTVQPQLPEFLYALSLSDGADPFLAAHYGSDPARNGEPFGELGVIRQQDDAWGDQHGKPRDPQAGNTPGGKRDVLRTSGNKPINSPDTDPPVAGAALVAPAAPTLEMAAFVSYGDQLYAPLVVSGQIGASVQYTLSDGTHTVAGGGVIGNDGKLSILVDVSTLADGTVTATARLTAAGLTSGPGSTTAQKKTVVPGSVGLALNGYVGIAGRAGSPITFIGDPGNYVEWDVAGPGGDIVDGDYLDANGMLTVWLNFLGYLDGTYYVSALQYDHFGNVSEVQTSVPQLTLDTVTPTLSVAATALTNNPTVTVSLSFGDERSGVNQYRISIDGGATWSAWAAPAASRTVTLPAPDGAYSVVVMVADKAGNTALMSTTVVLDRTGPSVAASLPAPTNGTSYDIGKPLALTWNVTDANGVGTISASIEGQTISASGGTIDVDVLTAGTHTVTITARDRAGNVTTKTLTFTIHATPEGIRAAIVDGQSRGWVSASFGANLLTQIDQVIKAEPNHSNMKAKLKQFITTVQYPYGASPITAAFQALLLNWANDLMSQL